ncbi:hypothetical protein GGX14DRAFT_569140 [Mycena pura]|uniref:Uncharacterized protein n=1 Tax=Mycena pura TaxID=153505 RepID=A0AAD6V7Q5_9AGAR|nr:hypothetical protein GGX14DRAFT_569140 [Mycena pura]
MASRKNSKKNVGAESIEELEARITALKQADTTKRSRGRPKGSKNKKAKDDDKANPRSQQDPAVTDPATEEAMDKKKPRGRQAAKAKGIPKVPWRTEQELTDLLLTSIEHNGPRRVAFGFTKGDLEDAGVTTGSTQATHCERLAQKVLVDHSSGRWVGVDPKALVSSVQNRITTLKLDFVKHKMSLGATGFGLALEDREDELYGDPQNVWEQIQAEFPWFKRLHRLLDGSPIHDTDACSNSRDSLDAKLLSFSSLSSVSRETLSMYNDDDDSNSDKDQLDEETIDLMSSRAESPALSTPPITAITTTGSKPTTATQSKSSAAKGVTARPESAAALKPAAVASAPKRKRDAMLDSLTNAVKLDHKHKAALLEASQATKRQRLEAEQKFRASEAEKNRAHELEKLRIQLQIAQLQAGVGTSLVHHGPSAAGPSSMSGSSGTLSSRSSTPYTVTNPLLPEVPEYEMPFGSSDDNLSLSALWDSTYSDTYGV